MTSALILYQGVVAVISLRSGRDKEQPSQGFAMSALAKTSLEQVLQQSVSRILAVVNPRKIILFGSAARGTQHDGSDLDILVIVANGTHRRQTSQQIYRNLIGLGYATDIIVVTEEDVENFRDTAGYVIQPALAEGRLLYAA